MKVFRFLTRVAAEHLSLVEFRVLLFIFDRTYGWRKREEKIPYKHFLNGIEKDGIVYAGKVGVSEKTLKKALRGLVYKEIIVKHRSRSTAVVSYCVHPELHETALSDDW